MTSFLDAFEQLTNNFDSDSDSNETQETGSTVCVSAIDHQLLHLYLMIPAAVTLLIMAFMMKRRFRCLNCFGGRPGMVYPMDILGRSNRFSYAAAWGSVAYLASDVILERKFATKIEGPSYIKVFAVLLSMLIYGLDYMPLFASLAQNSLVGYGIGTAYAWTFFAIQLVKTFECYFSVESRLILIARDLPNILCLGYLSFSMPVRFGLLIKKRQNLLYATERVAILGMKREIRESVEGRHCMKLLRPQPPPPPPPEGVYNKIKEIVTNLANTLLYKRHTGFRYSSRVLSVMLIGVILLYKTTIELLVVVLAVLGLLEKYLQVTLELVGWFEIPEEAEAITSTRTSLYFAYYIVIAFRACFITSITLAMVVGLVMILHMLSSYRTNLFALYRGDYTHIPHSSVSSNASLLVGSMRYAGYQVGYIAWGYIIQFFIFLLVSVALATVITLIQMGIYQWIIDILLNAWPVVLVTLLLNILQVVVAKFAFLQDRGAILAINNRRVLFTFSFFMFFYNIFLGVFSCLLRIIKAIVIGTLFLSRLDNSTLPRRFQLMDPGFSAYVGFIHVENAHTHPAVIVFLKLLMLQIQEKKIVSEGEKETSIDMENAPGKPGKTSLGEKVRVSAKARFNWYVMYTLYNNPQLRTLRKSYIDYMKEIQDRMARRYNLSHSAVGALMKSTNNAVNQIGLSDVNIEIDQTPGQGAMDAWAAMMNMNRFMANIQRDIARRQQLNMGIQEFSLEPSENESNGIEIEKKPATNLSKWGRLRVAVGTDKDNTTKENDTKL